MQQLCTTFAAYIQLATYYTFYKLRNYVFCISLRKLHFSFRIPKICTIYIYGTYILYTKRIYLQHTKCIIVYFFFISIYRYDIICIIKYILGCTENQTCQNCKWYNEMAFILFLRNGIILLFFFCVFRVNIFSVWYHYNVVNYTPKSDRPKNDEEHRPIKIWRHNRVQN